MKFSEMMKFVTVVMLSGLLTGCGWVIGEKV